MRLPGILMLRSNDIGFFRMTFFCFLLAWAIGKRSLEVASESSSRGMGYCSYSNVNPFDLIGFNLGVSPVPSNTAL